MGARLAYAQPPRGQIVIGRRSQLLDGALEQVSINGRMVSLQNALESYRSTGDKRIARAILNYYSPTIANIAASIARRIPQESDITLDGLLNAGGYGLLKFLDERRPDIGEFRGRASYVARIEMINLMREFDQLYSKTRRRIKKIGMTQAKIYAKEGRAGTDLEIAVATEMDEKVVKRLKAVAVAEKVELVAEIPLWVGETSVQLDKLIDGEQRRILKWAVETLPEEQRIFIKLFYVYGLTKNEIGSIFGAEERRVKWILESGVEKIRKVIDSYTLGSAEGYEPKQHPRAVLTEETKQDIITVLKVSNGNCETDHIMKMLENRGIRLSRGTDGLVEMVSDWRRELKKNGQALPHFKTPGPKPGEIGFYKRTIEDFIVGKGQTFKTAELAEFLMKQHGVSFSEDQLDSALSRWRRAGSVIERRRKDHAGEIRSRDYIDHVIPFIKSCKDGYWLEDVVRFLADTHNLSLTKTQVRCALDYWRRRGIDIPHHISEPRWHALPKRGLAMYKEQVLDFVASQNGDIVGKVVGFLADFGFVSNRENVNRALKTWDYRKAA